ncbi:MAG TPA: DNA polymerase Y family protein [Stellaceae bacterium]
MRRVMYLCLPRWPIDRLRRLGEKRPVSTSGHSAVPADAPFATIVAEGGRRLLAALNPAAEAAGLVPGMPLADALSFVPGLTAVPADPAADIAALTRLAEWCGRYSPWTAPEGADGIKIEITGCAHLWGGEEALAADLARRLARLLNSTGGIAHRLAIAGTLGAAWALARYAAEGAPAIVPTGAERTALAPLPVEALRLDPDTVRDLRRVGLRTVGELCPMPRDALARRFGESVVRRLDQAFGDLPEPLSPLGEPPLRRVRLSFAEPISDPADLARAIERLVQDLVPRLAREGIGARRLDLGFHRVDGRVEHIAIGTARPSRDPSHLAALFLGKLDTVDPGLGVEDTILSVFAVDPLPPEQLASPLPDPPPQAGEEVRRTSGGQVGASGDIAALLDRLGNRFGLAALRHLEPRQSHIPEKASVSVPVDEEKDRKISKPRRRSTPSPPAMVHWGAERAGVRWGIPERAPISPPHPAAATAAATLSPLKGGEEFSTNDAAKPPRPIRLFEPPEPVAASWLVPDSPPVQFTWRRRLYRVARADGPERIAEEWWTEDTSAAADAIRDYYRVEDEDGRRFWLYRSGLAQSEPPPRWFVHGIFA